MEPITYNVGLIRQKLIEQVENRVYSLHLGLWRDVKVLFEYYVRQRLTLKVIDSYCKEISAPTWNAGNKVCYLPSYLALRDINRVPVQAAAVAWLSFDGWRWDKEKYPGFPEDLSYGLVLEYPQPILAATAWLAGLTDKGFSLDDLYSAHETALKRVKEHHFPELSEEGIRERAYNSDSTVPDEQLKFDNSTTCF